MISNTEAKKNFHKKYPLTLLEAINTPCITCYGWKPLFPDIPLPSVRGIKDFILFTGAKDNALRTALSREKKKNNLVFFNDEKNILRYDMSSLGQGLTRFYHSEQELEGLTLAAFRFSSSQTKDRYRLKDILRCFSFHMLTQNVYISWRIPHEELLEAVEKTGLSGHLFLFDTDYPAGRALDRVLRIFKTDEWTRKIGEFYEDLKNYLSGDITDPEESFNRALYAGAANHIHIRSKLPPLPEKLFPGKKTFEKVKKTIADYYKKNLEKHIEVYRKHNGGDK